MSFKLAVWVLIVAAPCIGAQQTAMSVNCGEARLVSAARATCTERDFKRLAASIDSVSARLEKTLAGDDQQALLDTELAARTQRNDCANHGAAMRACVDSILNTRLRALVATASSPGAIRGELSRYTFIGVPYLLKWGNELPDKQVNVWGCLELEPGTNFATRLHGLISTDCERADAPRAPVVFTRMFPGRAALIDSMHPAGYWPGTVKRQSGRVVLEIDPGAAPPAYVGRE